MITPSEFILARTAEDEERAGSYHRLLCMRTACDAEDCIWGADEEDLMGQERVCTCGYPARVLAQCAAYRSIVDEYGPSMDADGRVDRWSGNEIPLRILASIWSDHPDYDPNWAL